MITLLTDKYVAMKNKSIIKRRKKTSIYQNPLDCKPIWIAQFNMYRQVIDTNHINMIH